MTGEQFIVMKIASILGCSPRDVENLPNSEVMEWECFFYDESKMETESFYKARKAQNNTLSPEQMKSASNVKAQGE